MALRSDEVMSAERPRNRFSGLPQRETRQPTVFSLRLDQQMLHGFHLVGQFGDRAIDHATGERRDFQAGDAVIGPVATNYRHTTHGEPVHAARADWLVL